MPRSRPHYGTANTAYLDTDEGRLLLCVETDEADYTFDIHGASQDLYESVQRLLIPHHREMEDARATRPQSMTREDIMDVYRDHPAKRHTMLEETEKVNRPW